RLHPGGHHAAAGGPAQRWRRRARALTSLALRARSRRLPRSVRDRAPQGPPITPTARAAGGRRRSVRSRARCPSLSLTLDNLRTRTEVRFSDDLETDEASLDGRPASG